MEITALANTFGENSGPTHFLHFMSSAVFVKLKNSRYTMPLSAQTAVDYFCKKQSSAID